MQLLRSLTLTFTLFALIPTAQAEVLWNNWYKITVENGFSGGYYHEKAETKQGKVYVETKIFRSEEGFVNEEHIGEIAKDSPELTPLFMSIIAKFRTDQLKIDGTFDGFGVLSVEIEKNGKKLPSFKKNFPRTAILSTTFPIWLKSRLPNIKGAQSLSFSAIHEESSTDVAHLENGTVRKLEPDAFAKQTGTLKIQVFYLGESSTWWVHEKSGIYERIEMPTRKVLVEKTTEDLAKESIGSSKPASSVAPTSSKPNPAQSKSSSKPKHP